MGPCDDATTAADGKGCQHRHRRLASSALFLRLLSQFNRCRVAIDGVGPGRPSSKSLGGTAGPSLLPRASFGIERALLALERGVIFFFEREGLARRHFSFCLADSSDAYELAFPRASLSSLLLSFARSAREYSSTLFSRSPPALLEALQGVKDTGKGGGALV